jgi:hypothetical protein
VVVKFSGFYRLKIYGTVVAKGNPGDKIIFTSTKDCEFGATETSESERLSPQTNDWDLIEFNDDKGQIPSELSHSLIRYSAGIVQYQNAFPAIENILITDCQSNQSVYQWNHANGQAGTRNYYNHQSLKFNTKTDY